MNKLAGKNIYLTIWLIVVVIVVTSFSIYINATASSGSAVKTSLHTINGDPSVLADQHINAWAIISDGYDFRSFSKVMRNTVIFDEAGHPDVKSYSQVYENAFSGDDSSFWISDYRSIRDMGLDYENLDLKWQSDTIQDFSVNIYSGVSSTYLIDNCVYSIVKRMDIYDELDRKYPNTDLELIDFSFTGGIFRADGKTTENVLPIQFSSDSETAELLDVVYIPETKCFALSVIENNELYVYIYHIETGVADKLYIAVYHDPYLEAGDEWYYQPYYGRLNPPMAVSDNFLTIASGQDIAHIETDKTADSVVRYLTKVVLSSDDMTIYRLLNYSAHIFMKDGLLYVYSTTYDTFNDDAVFYVYKLYVHVFNESGLIFSGFIPISQGPSHSTQITTSNDIPYVTENNWAVRRWW